MSRVLLLSTALMFVAPAAAACQETSGAPDRVVTVSVSAGHTSAYRGGATYLVSALYSRPARIPVEVAFEYTPTPAMGHARILWLGLRYPRGVPINAFYAGGRGGLLDGPSYTGWLVDLHVGLQVGWKNLGVRVEPALLRGFDETPFAAGRLTAGLSWRFH